MPIISKTRLFVEKKKEFRIEAESLKNELNRNLHLHIRELRFIVVYDVFNIEELLLEKAIQSVFSESVTDNIYVQNLSITSQYSFAVEFLPGQFDQRADSAKQCLQLIDPKSEALIKSAKLYMLDGSISDEDLQRIKKYCINEVEAREKDMSVLDASEDITIEDIPVYSGFIELSEEEIDIFRNKHGLAMSLEDILFVQHYFKKEEHRDPTETEIKVLDTYWSDHCRHTTFETEIMKVSFSSSLFQEQLQDAFETYKKLRTHVHGNKKPMTLMDMATICGKYERKTGNLDDMELSDEINACSVFVDVDVDGKTEKWLLMFKNETHNHPTEIEPFGGASTCVGGAIRDPLSGRSYVYQALRVSGAGDITEPVEKTMEGKLPQRVISKTAAHGYSSYGNQIGLACTHVREIYHEGYKAKRMEIGAVVGAVPANYVRREKPKTGDVVIMFGGRTGRDGIGGATGSSKEHNETSLEKCAAEVQKGNPPEERKIQRLFRNPEVTKLIKKSNDFGAGGVSVAIGELADGLEINLNKIKTKYKGLNGTELAISESQERMSVVVAPEDVETFMEHCRKENIEATVIATITFDNRLKIKWNEKTIVNICREFINTSGIRQKTNIISSAFSVPTSSFCFPPSASLQQHIETVLSDLNVASQQNMLEIFDSTIGATTVLMPFGGKYQLTETQASVQKLPVLNGFTDTCSIMTFGFNPFISECSPFHGAQYAIIESIAKLVAVGGDYRKIRFTFQEYFEKLGKDEEKWGKPFAALLGAIVVQNFFHLPAIGGKDSMSGTFKHLNVPPTLVSFAVATQKASNIISPEFKKTGNFIYLVKHKTDEHQNPNLEQLKEVFNFMVENISNNKIISAFTCQLGGIIEALCKMSFGNDLGFDINTSEDLFCYNYGSFIIEMEEELSFEHSIFLGKVSDSIIINNEKIDKNACLKAWQGTFLSNF